MRRPGQYFRAGAGAVIFNSRGLVLALERTDVPGAWQLPQGGLEDAEEPIRAALREVAEETGIDERDLLPVAAYPEPLVYELPAGARSEKTGRGQVQYWFLFRFLGREETIDVTGGGEFRAWKWAPFEDLVDAAVEFRRPLYRRLLDYFEPQISGCRPADPSSV